MQAPRQPGVGQSDPRRWPPLPAGRRRRPRRSVRCRVGAPPSGVSSTMQPGDGRLALVARRRRRRRRRPARTVKPGRAGDADRRRRPGVGADGHGAPAGPVVVRQPDARPRGAPTSCRPGRRRSRRAVGRRWSSARDGRRAGEGHAPPASAGLAGVPDPVGVEVLEDDGPQRRWRRDATDEVHACAPSPVRSTRRRRRRPPRCRPARRPPRRTSPRCGEKAAVPSAPVVVREHRAAGRCVSRRTCAPVDTRLAGVARCRRRRRRRTPRP